MHLIAGDLNLLKKTLKPIKTLIYGLREYDDDRGAALIDSSSTSGTASTKVAGFMSLKAKINLADVHDHMDHILSSLDLFSRVSENVINYNLNVWIFSIVVLSNINRIADIVVRDVRDEQRNVRESRVPPTFKC